MKRVIVSVINDLSTDQRVHKVCCTFKNLGYDVTLIGRKQKNSLPLENRNYSTIRLNLVFEKGPLFYLEFNLHLLFFLLFKKADVLYANDLDTLLPNYLISKIKKSILVYDTHELFCEVPELKKKPFKKRIWKTIEKNIFPKLKYVFTVNNSIAKIYSDEYHVPVKVLRNVPLIRNKIYASKLSKQELGFDSHKKIIILQGTGINIDRGAEEAVKAMQHVNNAILLIIGGGDVFNQLKQLTIQLKLQNKITLINKLPYEQLLNYTRIADIGITLDKDSNLNYRYSLPNKLFDYIHAGVPVIASDLVEVKAILSKYDIGTLVKSHSPEHIAQKINEVLNDQETLLRWKKNTTKATNELNWENEELKLISTIEQFKVN